MELRVHGTVPTRPFEEARSRLEPAHDVQKPIDVEIGSDPDQRTWTGHHADRHVLSVSRRAATSAMATELFIHEFAHMRRAEQSHPSHAVDAEEALFLALAGRQVPSDVIPHAYQITNHLRDIYADDITLTVSSGEKLVAFLESELASAVLDGSGEAPVSGYSLSRGNHPGLTVVNAAFALGLLDRNGIEAEHRLEDLAQAASRDAPEVDLFWFRRQFRSVQMEPTEVDCLRTLVETIGKYFDTIAKDAKERNFENREVAVDMDDFHPKVGEIFDMRLGSDKGATNPL